MNRCIQIDIQACRTTEALSTPTPNAYIHVISGPRHPPTPTPGVGLLICRPLGTLR